MIMSSMRGFHRSAFAVLLVLIAVPSYAFEGPLQVRNQFPIFIFLDPPYLESAEVRNSATVSLSHSSVYVIETSAPWTVNMDIELTELMVRFKKTLNSRTEVGLDLPFYRPTEGFLDGPLASFHDALGMGDYGRHDRPENEFLYELLYQGRPVISPKNGESGIGDVRLTAKRVVLEGETLVSVTANVEFPTGDAKAGYGNGSYDAGLAVLVDRDIGKVYRGYANAGVIFPGELKGLETIPLRTSYYGGIGIEAAWWERFHVIVQTLVATSPYPDTGIRQVDWPGVLLVFGGRYSSGPGSLEFSLTEDPDTAGAPDFTMNMAFCYRF
jgi:hypothetical protein